MLGQRSFRDVLGRFATGVLLVTAHTRHGPAGMTVNAFMSVSLDPPLVALCAARSSVTWPAIRSVGGFAAAILAEEHAELCQVFATHGTDRFAEPDWWAATGAGHPVPPDALAWLDCEITEIHAVGDHEVVVAEALAGMVRSPEGEPTDAGTGRPLVFHEGRFTTLAARSAVSAGA
jgi:3-hydroxy-9,10-secoandrosta-1,3,5(10)-triene-9,17-dione monooxygenase reductase component